MKKLLIISVLTVTASLAHAGSCGDKGSKDESEKKTGISEPTTSIACGKKDGDKKGTGTEGFVESAGMLACDCAGDGKKDKKGSATFSESPEFVA